jgi:hypothetical protein
MSQGLKKTIQINPELFKIPGKNKTKNNREKSSKPEKPITPNLLKKQLLERIKNHKQKQEINTKTFDEPTQSKEEEDEFILSMNFLSSLSDQEKKIPTQTTFINIPEQPVNIDLPLELINLDNTFSSVISTPIKEEIPEEFNFPVFEKKNKTPDVPYGCLKNGKKPTYRSWKNNSSYTDSSSHKDSSSHNESPNLTEREKKLNQLKNKFKEEEEPVYVKRIIKKKYTLGKSKIFKKVGVLIKNINTRKKIIDSHKELKTHDISDVKNYLKTRGLIKIGNNTPTDILRKIYESSILTGEIINNNKDILLHNLMNDH